MSDKIKVEVELDLQDLAVFRQVGEEDWSGTPVSITEAVVRLAAQQITKAALDEATQGSLRARVEAIQSEVIREMVSEKVEKALAQGVQRTNDYGTPIGEAIPLTELIDKEIKRQLVHSGRGSYGSKTVLDSVIEANVNHRLTADLNAAFLTARDAMLKAAQDAGAAALRAAVTKAVG